MRVKSLYKLPLNGYFAKRLNHVNTFGSIKTVLMLTGENKKSTLLEWMDRKLKRTAIDYSLKESRNELQDKIGKLKIVNSISSTNSLSRDDWKELGILSQGYLVEEIQFPFPPDLSGIHKLLAGVKNVQFQCLVLHQGRCVPHAFIKFSDRRICLEDLDSEADNPGDSKMRYADVIIDVDGQQSETMGQIISKCDFEAVLIAEWAKFNASSFVAGLNGKKIRRLAVHNLDNAMTQFLRHYKSTQELFINKKIHDEKVVRGCSKRMKVTTLSPAFWEESFLIWW